MRRRKPAGRLGTFGPVRAGVSHGTLTRMDVDANGLEVLDPAECRRLLASRSLGRISVSSGALPVILPVNYLLLDDEIVLRTRRGTRLAAATRHAIVAFEVDDIDDDTGTGWSVMVQGIARELAESPGLRVARAADLARWIDPGDSRHVGISLDVVTGRRIPSIEVLAERRSTMVHDDRDGRPTLRLVDPESKGQHEPSRANRSS